MEEIKIGDQVQLYLWNFTMVVNKINQDGSIECYWYDKNSTKFYSHTFDRSLLKVVGKFNEGKNGWK